jgi:uncharacterized protein (TIGR02118 family)
MTKKYVFVVYTKPTPGKEEEFNRWYDEVHIPDVLRLPGFLSATRYRYEAVANTSESTHPYLALYTVETDDIHATQAALTAAANTPAMPLNDALDLPGVKSSYFVALQD